MTDQQQHVDLSAFLDMPSGTPFDQNTNPSCLTSSMMPSLSQSSLSNDHLASMLGMNMGQFDPEHIPTGTTPLFGLPSSAAGGETFDQDHQFDGRESYATMAPPMPYGYDNRNSLSHHMVDGGTYMSPNEPQNNQSVPLSPARTGQGTVDMGSYSYPDGSYHQRILQYHKTLAQGHLGQTPMSNAPHHHLSTGWANRATSSHQPTLSLQERRRQKRLEQQAQVHHQQQPQPSPNRKRSASLTDHPDLQPPASKSRPRTSESSPASVPSVPSTMPQAHDGLVYNTMGIMYSGALSNGTTVVAPAEPMPPHHPYSSSGFDMVKALVKVTTRPNPIVNIGPVDESCSFTVVDVDLPDQPIVYCSDTFLRLTGYERDEVLGRNCRFLQAPAGSVEKGTDRCATDHQAVQHLAKFSSQRKDCQASLINYRKDGQPFINLVTIVPISWDDDHPQQTKYLVGFQIDLVKQPGSIVEKMPDGSYFVNYSSVHMSAPPHSMALAQSSSQSEPRKFTGNAAVATTVTLSSEQLAKERKVDNVQNISDAVQGTCKDGQTWAKLVLENAHDLIYVLSLKGLVLYVSPSVEQILGFQPHELIGCSIADFTHPSDVVPVFRELKDSTSNASIAASTRSTSHRRGRGGARDAAPSVNLLFRMRCKNNTYRWIESNGKLHLEQGKGRKVVVSTGRPRPVYHLNESVVKQFASSQLGFWARVSTEGMFLNVLPPVANVLRLGPGQLMGKKFNNLVDPAAVTALNQAARMPYATSVLHTLPTGDGSNVAILSSFYPSSTVATETQFTVPHMSVWVHMARASSEQVSRLVPNVVLSSESASAAVAENLETNNTFSEMAPLRGSSWCYELHLLKNTNRRLKEDLRAAHTKRATARATSSSSSSSPSSESSPTFTGASSGGGTSRRAARRTPKTALSDAAIRDLLYCTSPAPKTKSRAHRSSSGEAGSGIRSSGFSSSSSTVREGSLSTQATSSSSCAPSVSTFGSHTNKAKRPYSLSSGPSSSSKSSLMLGADALNFVGQHSPSLSRDTSGSGSS